MNVAICTNSHSSYSDLWTMHFGQLDRHLPRALSRYLFTDSTGVACHANWLVDGKIINYNPADLYWKQYVACMAQVPSDYIIYLQEDHILYGDVDLAEIMTHLNWLRHNPFYSYVRLLRAGIRLGPPLSGESLRLVYNWSPVFAMQPTIWRRADLIRLYKAARPARIIDEPRVGAMCEAEEIWGGEVYCGEPKRGATHWDSKIFPCICTAVVKGKWNMREYSVELKALFAQYGIDASIRGVLQ